MGAVQMQHYSNVKKIEVKVDELTTIHTAVGIATIIQLPEPIQGVIIGDLGAFKIEYLDKAITIKPLRFGARTNLYITTPSRRFNVRLVTQNQDSSDYVVYLSAKEQKKEKSVITWREIKRSAKTNSLSIELKRIGRTKDGFVLVDFLLKSLDGEKKKIDPESLWLKQGKDSKIINGLFLSSENVDDKNPLQIVMTLNQNDLISEIPATIELKGLNSISIEIPKEALWRK